MIIIASKRRKPENLLKKIPQRYFGGCYESGDE